MCFLGFYHFFQVRAIRVVFLIVAEIFISIDVVIAVKQQSLISVKFKDNEAMIAPPTVTIPVIPESKVQIVQLFVDIVFYFAYSIYTELLLNDLYNLFRRNSALNLTISISSHNVPRFQTSYLLAFPYKYIITLINRKIHNKTTFI